MEFLFDDVDMHCKIYEYRSAPREIRSMSNTSLWANTTKAIEPTTEDPDQQESPLCLNDSIKGSERGLSSQEH